jgi:hypothetical protein
MTKIYHRLLLILNQLSIYFINLINFINKYIDSLIINLPHPSGYLLYLYKKALGRGMILYTSLFIFTGYFNDFLNSLIKYDKNNQSLILFVQGLLVCCVNIWIIAAIAAPTREWLNHISNQNKK